MVRPTQHLHARRTPAVLRHAATVLLLRDSANGPEVLMTRRSMSASFAPGAYVFPGGGIDAADAQSHHLSTRRSTQSDTQLTQAIAAIRESFEELGILLARHPDGSRPTTADIAHMDRQAAFAAQCAERGLQLDGADVFVLARWVTDRDLPRRFDVPFLVARMPEQQSPVADESEQFEPVWVRPADALARHAAGGFFIIFPTIRTLQWLQGYASVESVLQACAANEKPLFVSCPRAGLVRGQESRHMEHEAEFGELALVTPDGQISHHLDWQCDHPVALLKNLQRLTAPNPGFMTGPGTNSYCVGDPNTGYIVIDPGPDDAAHLERLWRATGGDIRAIVCTHSHPDHSPGARHLQSLCKRTQPPILGLPSAHTARANSHFIPDRTLQDGERLQLSGQGSDGPITHTLQVIHTPGHAANHVCLILEEDGLLFSGDHILNGSTTVIDPPDGNMAAYLASLDRLAQCCDQHQIYFILPAHGYVLGDWPQSPDNPSGPVGGGAKMAITQLKKHRLLREAKVAQAMAELPHGHLDDWVKLAYSDVPERLWPVAKRSLAAHVEHIQSLAGFNG